MQSDFRLSAASTLALSVNNISKFSPQHEMTQSIRHLIKMAELNSSAVLVVHEVNEYLRRLNLSSKRSWILSRVFLF